jgi:hypothetical protein
MDELDEPGLIDLRAWRAHRDLYKLAESANWDRIFRRLTRYARKHTATGATGDQPEDLAQAAIVHFYARMDTWDPEAKPLIWHLAGVLDGIVVNKKRIGPNRGAHLEPREEGVAAFVAPPPMEPEALQARPHADAQARPAGGFEMPDTSRLDAAHGEDEIEDRDLARRVVDEIAASLADAPIALEVLGAYARGVDDPMEQAELLGHPLKVIRAAQERIHRHAKKARAKLGGSKE